LTEDVVAQLQVASATAR